MSALRPFSPSVRVTAAEAKQDGITLDMGDWFIQGIGNSIGAFVDLLGPRPEEGSVNAWANIITNFPTATLEPEFFGWMFNRPAGNFDEHTEMNLSAGGSGSVPRPGAPLAKGKLQFKRYGPIGEDVMTDEQRRRLQLRLFLNPTRFVRHQTVPSPRMLARNPRDWTLEEADLRTRALPRRRTTSEHPAAEVETTLDNNDNVLLGRDALSFARPDAWGIHLRRYFECVETALADEFRRASVALHPGRRRVPILHAPYYALRKVETYFEFSARNPVQLLRRLRPVLESLGKRYRTRSFPSGRAEFSSEGDSPRALLTLASGRELRIYAKTSARVRFEIIHDVIKSGVSRLLRAERGGYTTASRSELLGWFPMLALDAAKHVNEVLASLQSRSQVPADSADTYELIGEIFDAVSNTSRARQILALLVENGCLRVGRRGSEFLPEIRQLRRKGVLESISSANNVTPLYRAALDTLREQAGLPPLAASF